MAVPLLVVFHSEASRSEWTAIARACPLLSAVPLAFGHDDEVPLGPRNVPFRPTGTAGPCLESVRHAQSGRTARRSLWCGACSRSRIVRQNSKCTCHARRTYWPRTSRARATHASFARRGTRMRQSLVTHTSFIRHSRVSHLSLVTHPSWGTHASLAFHPRATHMSLTPYARTIRWPLTRHARVTRSPLTLHAPVTEHVRATRMELQTECACGCSNG
jgi:hypothetical protein